MKILFLVKNIAVMVALLIFKKVLENDVNLRLDLNERCLVVVKDNFSRVFYFQPFSRCLNLKIGVRDLTSVYTKFNSKSIKKATNKLVT